MPIIEVKNFSKVFKVMQKESGIKNSLKSFFKREYKHVKAVNNINISIEKNEIVGLIGLNGAGKTTTLKALSGLIYPTEGEIEVLGHVPWDKENLFLKRIGFLMGNKSQLWWDLPAIDSFRLEGSIYDISEEELENRINKLVDLLDVSSLLNTPVRKLSLGERMKMEFILVLLHEPEVIFLDEPTIGLDIITQKTVRKFLKNYRQDNNATILVTSHNMKDIEELCERVIIIDEGSIVFDNTLSELKKEYIEDKILKIEYSDREFLKMAEKFFAGYNLLGENQIGVRLKESEINSIKERLKNDSKVVSTSIEELSLEDILDSLLNKSRLEAKI